MEKSNNTKEAVCGEEAVALLNCVAETPYDQDKCLYLLTSLRTCVLQKKVKKFSLAGNSTNQGETAATANKA